MSTFTTLATIWQKLHKIWFARHCIHLFFSISVYETFIPTPQNRFALFFTHRDKDGSKFFRLVIAQTQEWPETANHSQFTRLASSYFWPAAGWTGRLKNHLPLALGLRLNPVTAVILSLLLSCNLTAAPQSYADSFKAECCAVLSKCVKRQKLYLNIHSRGISGLFRLFPGH